jgi:hypothetical protein
MKRETFGVLTQVESSLTYYTQYTLSEKTQTKLQQKTNGTPKMHSN